MSKQFYDAKSKTYLYLLTRIKYYVSSGAACNLIFNLHTLTDSRYKKKHGFEI